MNLRQMLALEPGFEAQPLGPALPRVTKQELPKPHVKVANGVFCSPDGKMRTAFVEGKHYARDPRKALAFKALSEPFAKQTLTQGCQVEIVAWR